jgi:hypothetical protein
MAKAMPRRYGERMGRSGSPCRGPVTAGVALLLALTSVGCGRSGFPGFDGEPTAQPGAERDATVPTVDGSSSTPGADASPVPVDAAPPPVIPTGTSTGPSPPPPPPTRPPPVVCIPTPETCNGVDVDCNEQVDDDVAPIPCPDGGERYCINGRFSACPDRCDACIPGSERVCFLSYCTFWAKQVCAADGRSFGVCREDPVPRECRAIAERHKDSRQLEQCCIDKGYCCRDEFDLDGDGDRNDMVGACDEVACR